MELETHIAIMSFLQRVVKNGRSLSIDEIDEISFGVSGIDGVQIL